MTDTAKRKGNTNFTKGMFTVYHMGIEIGLFREYVLTEHNTYGKVVHTVGIDKQNFLYDFYWEPKDNVDDTVDINTNIRRYISLYRPIAVKRVW